MGMFFKLLAVACKVREFLRGKKTILSSTVGLMTSGGAIITLVILWSEGTINGKEFINQVQVPGAVFWTALTFLWAVFHHDNVAAKQEVKP